MYCCFRRRNDATSGFKQSGCETITEEGQSDLLQFQETFKELLDGYYNEEGEFIDMSQPRPASYNKTDEKGAQEEKIRLGKDRERQNVHDSSQVSSFQHSYVSLQTELRGITLTQLEAVRANIERRCLAENWTREVQTKSKRASNQYRYISPEEVNLYDIAKYIIKPFTQYTRKSFVETLPSTAGDQPPRWFVSHYWGESFQNTLKCLHSHNFDFRFNFEKNQSSDNHEEQGGGMSLDSPIWICAFANNQYDLENEITDDPSETGFAKAMSIADFRTISILDEKGTVFTRLWCGYEINMALILPLNLSKSSKWAVYTAFEHETFDGEQKLAVGIVQSGAPNEVAMETELREEHFPTDRIFDGLNVSIEDAEASREEDKRHILNAIVGRKGQDLNKDPLIEHERYNELNRAVRGAFASTIPAIIGAYKADSVEKWNKTLLSMKFGPAKVMRLNFNDYGVFGQDNANMNEYDAAEMIRHLPVGLNHIVIEHCPYGPEFYNAFFDWVETATDLKDLRIYFSCVGTERGGYEMGKRLANILKKESCQINSLRLHCSDLLGSRNADEWIEALSKNTSLRDTFDVYGMYNVRDQVKDETYNEETMDYKAPSTFGRIFYQNGTFPDATLTKEQEMKIRSLIKAKDCMFYNMSESKVKV